MRWYGSHGVRELGAKASAGHEIDEIIIAVHGVSGVLIELPTAISSSISSAGANEIPNSRCLILVQDLGK